MQPVICIPPLRYRIIGIVFKCDNLSCFTLRQISHLCFWRLLSRFGHRSRHEAGCAIDGIEIPALYTLKRSGFTITEIILGLNIVIFLTVAFHPQLGFETALYAILTYYVVSKTIDYVVDGLEAYTGVTIISSEAENM